MKTYTQFVIESLELNLTKLQKHVTETEPTTGNVVKMHDMIRNIARQHNISSSKLYSNIINNNSAHDKYKQAATLDEPVEKIDEAKGSFRAGYNKAKNRFSNINKQIQTRI